MQMKINGFSILLQLTMTLQGTYGLDCLTTKAKEITVGMMALHSLTETGEMDSQEVVTTKIMFTLQEQTWEA